MAIKYCVVEIYTSEGGGGRGPALAQALVRRVRDLKIAARCLVTRGVAGCREDGEIASGGLEVLSLDMPLKIEIVLPSAELDRVLPLLDELVLDGIVLVGRKKALFHRVKARLLPPALRVKDIMSPEPRAVGLPASAADIVHLLVSGTFNGVPVVDEDGKPVGVVTQSDLVRRAGLPVRLGVLRDVWSPDADAALQGLEGKTAAEIMTAPAVTVPEDAPVEQAVARMLERGLKRLPVVDGEGRLCGMLSRVDVFRTVTRENPDWTAMSRQGVSVGPAGQVSRIVNRDVHAVLASTPIEEVLRVIDDGGLQRVAVVDEANRLLGLICDRDLLPLFAGQPGFWARLGFRVPFLTGGKKPGPVGGSAWPETAGEAMRTDIVTVPETASVEDAVRLMVDGRIKRLPVVGPNGEFRGLVSRDAVLRAGLKSS